MTGLSAPAGMDSLVLRPMTDDDQAFLLALYISVRAPEFAALGWNEVQLGAFLEGQYRLQAHQYAQYDTSDFAIVVVDGEAVGRLYVEHGEDGVHIVDISLLPAWRGRGLGAALLRSVMTAGRPVSLHVADGNPARRLYERLGFRETGQRNGPYAHMVWAD